MYCVVDVIGGVSLGSNPRRARCDGVKAMSARLSFFLMSGESDITILKIDIKLRILKNVMV